MHTRTGPNQYASSTSSKTTSNQASLPISTVPPQPSLFAHIMYGSRRRVRQKIKTSRPIRWLCMRVWRMSLWRTKSTIISWDGSFSIHCWTNLAKLLQCVLLYRCTVFCYAYLYVLQHIFSAPHSHVSAFLFPLSVLKIHFSILNFIQLFHPNSTV